VQCLYLGSGSVPEIIIFYH